MRIDVYPTPDLVVGDLYGKTVIVIDLLRATTSITTAVENGCRMVVPVVSVEEALICVEKFDKDEILLCGERGGVLIEGFDLANSPLEYSVDRVLDKVVITTTTNGTIAINAAKGAKNVIIACLRNAAFAAKAADRLKSDIVIICAGTQKKYSMDDILCAGAIVHHLKNLGEYGLCDLSITAQKLYEEAQGDIDKALLGTLHYEKMRALGFYDDLKFCFEQDVCDTVPVFVDGAIVKMR